MMNSSLYELKDLVERLNETLSHLDGSQADDLKSMLDSSKMPEGSPEEEASESPMEEMKEDGKPKGLSIEKVEVLGKPNHGVGADDSESSEKLPGEEEMSDDELNELLKKHLS
jgi:hypothetical protein